MTHDPVCGLDVDEGEAIERGTFCLHKEQTYYFCSTECLMRFREHPEDFGQAVPQWDSSVPEEFLG